MTVNTELAMSVVIEESAVGYSVNLTMSMCGFYTDDGECDDVVVFTALPLKKFSCFENRHRRKRELGAA